MADNRSLCQAWANCGCCVRRGNHMSGNHMSIGKQGELYSYSTCIGQRVECGGKVLYIVDTARYSTSTCKHQIEMMRALRGISQNLVFDVHNAEWGRTRWVPIKDGQVLNGKKYIARVSMCFIAQELLHCMRVATCRSVKHGFTRHGYMEAVRLLQLSGVATVNGLLRMKVSDFMEMFGDIVYELDATYDEYRIMKNFLRKFLRLMHSGAEIATVVDVISGTGTWEAYMKRTAGARKRMANYNKACGTQRPYAA